MKGLSSKNLSKLKRFIPALLIVSPARSRSTVCMEVVVLRGLKSSLDPILGGFCSDMDCERLLARDEPEDNFLLPKYRCSENVLARA